MIRGSALFLPALVCVALAALVKSAQFPAHVWLPRAMVAPTPVNAFEDSAAVVAAGVFLLVRTHPLFAGEPAWSALLIVGGLASMLVGGWLALRAAELKVLLAYSTVSQFGFMFVLLGAGTPQTLAAALFFLIQHGVLKAGLFLVVGVVGLHAGVWRLGAAPYLARRMPVTCAAACVLGLSLAGVPPAAGFWMKEAFFESLLDAGAAWLSVISIAGAALTFAYILRWLGGTFFSPAGAEAPRESRATSIGVPVAVPTFLAGLSLALGVYPSLVTDPLVNPAGQRIAGADAALDLTLHLGTPLALSGAALLVGLGVHRLLARPTRRVPEPSRGSRVPERMFAWIGRAMLTAGRWTLRLQNGSLLRYTTLTLLAAGGLVVLAAFLAHDPGALLRFPPFSSAGLDFRMTLLLVLISAGTLLTFTLRKHLQIVLMLGAVGYLIAGVFALSFAPNLGLLQVHVETLVTVLLVLPLAAIPRELRERFFVASVERVTWDRLALSAAAGVGAAWASWFAIEHIPAQPVAREYAEGFPGAVEATDLVAAILIHYRALDTLGEIVVFATAAIGVLVLGRLIREERR